MKKKVQEVLQDTGYAESRAAKMDIDDLLKCVPIRVLSISSNDRSRLLSAFHDVGIHFA